ncbi:prolipoprotein diacylglyceryl transferase [soil metagenome]
MLAYFNFPNISPVIFRLGPIAIRWYGMAYLAAFAAAYGALRWRIRHHRLDLTPLQLSDLLSWLVAGVIFGGRIGWWLAYYRASPGDPWYEPFAIWHGGMSFHGGLTGVVIAAAVWTRRARVPLLDLTDSLAIVTPLGLFFGRLANFVNVELVGRPTTVPWGVIFPGETFARHPSQLYEAMLEGPVLLGVLWLVERLLGRRYLSGAFLITYGLIRFTAEFFREPDPQLGFIAFGWLTMGQILSLATAVAGVVVIAMRRKGPVGSAILEPSKE